MTTVTFAVGSHWWPWQFQQCPLLGTDKQINNINVFDSYTNYTAAEIRHTKTQEQDKMSTAVLAAHRGCNIHNSQWSTTVLEGTNSIVMLRLKVHSWPWKQQFDQNKSKLGFFWSVIFLSNNTLDFAIGRTSAALGLKYKFVLGRYRCWNSPRSNVKIIYSPSFTLWHTRVCTWKC